MDRSRPIIITFAALNRSFPLSAVGRPSGAAEKRPARRADCERGTAAAGKLRLSHLARGQPEPLPLAGTTLVLEHGDRCRNAGALRFNFPARPQRAERLGMLQRCHARLIVIFRGSRRGSATTLPLGRLPVHGSFPTAAKHGQRSGLGCPANRVSQKSQIENGGIQVALKMDAHRRAPGSQFDTPHAARISPGRQIGLIGRVRMVHRPMHPRRQCGPHANAGACGS